MPVSVPVITVQQGLTQVHRANPRSVASPGPIDGVFGTATKRSLAGFISLVGGPNVTNALRSINAIPIQSDLPRTERISAITMDLNPYATLLRTHAMQYQAEVGMSAGSAGGSAGSRAARQTGTPDPAQVVEQARSEAENRVGGPPSAALFGPTTSRSFPWVPVLLGLGAAVVVVGGGYWLYTSAR